MTDEVYAFREATWNGDEKKVKKMLNNGINPNMGWPGGSRHTEILKLLLKFGANPNGIASESINPLSDVIRNGTVESVLILLKAGAKTEFSDTSDGSTPLIIASEYQNAEMVKTLLDYGANPNVQTNEGRTALMQAVLTSDEDAIDTVKILMAYKSDSTLSDTSGDNVISLAESCLEDFIYSEIKTILKN